MEARAEQSPVLTCQHIPDFDHPVLQARGQKQAVVSFGRHFSRARCGEFRWPGAEGEAPHRMAAAEAFVFTVGLTVLIISEREEDTWEV